MFLQDQKRQIIVAFGQLLLVVVLAIWSTVLFVEDGTLPFVWRGAIKTIHICLPCCIGVKEQILFTSCSLTKWVLSQIEISQTAIEQTSLVCPAQIEAPQLNCGADGMDS